MKARILGSWGYPLLLAAAVLLGACASGSKEPEKTMEYVCPMHPEVREDKPGKCPKCGMELKPVQKKTTEHQRQH